MIARRGIVGHPVSRGANLAEEPTSATAAPKPKVYKHTFEDADVSPEDRAAIAAKMDHAFRGRCRRILLVNVSQIGEDRFVWENARQGRYPCFPPYGPALLVRVLEEHGYEADVVDLGYEIMASAHAAPSADRFDYQIWKEILSRRVNEFGPHLIGLSCMFNMGHAELAQNARYLKAHHGDIPIMAGGVHPTLTADQVLVDVPEIDFIGLFESDQSFVDFLAVANHRAEPDALAQVATTIDGKKVRLTKRHQPTTINLTPDYKRLPIERYSAVGKIGAYTFLRPASAVAAVALSTRGCRAACGFCSVRSVNGAGVRTRDVLQVVDEIERQKQTYGVSHIMWLDDDLFFDADRACTLFEEIARRDLGVTWDASNGIIAASLTPRLLKACVESGCVGFNIGVESGNPSMLKMMKKPGTVDVFKKAARLLDGAPEIFTKGFLVIGFPGETLSMLLDTVHLALDLTFDWYPIQILTPMPRTPIYQMMADLGLLGDIPATVLGKGRSFSVGATGTLAVRERAEKKSGSHFDDLFSGDRERVPARDEMEDLWFTIDYRINYESILHETRVEKLKKKRSMLTEICDRMTTENALGELFLGITEARLGNTSEAQRRLSRARMYRDESNFWQKRFDVLAIDALLEAETNAVA